MGSSNWSSDAWSNLKKTRATQSTSQIFQNNTISSEMSPLNLKFRESRDSVAHPNSLGVMVFLDVTGSMLDIPEVMVRKKLGTLMETLISHGIDDGHVFFGAIGDHKTDKYPLQVGQFEAGTDELNKWLSSVVLEGNGGANYGESYLLAWNVAASHTSMDCFEKRGEKGILFTIGDERTHPEIDAASLKEIFGYAEARNATAKELLEKARQSFHVFHLHCEEGSNGHDAKVVSDWKALLGENLILLSDKSLACEIIASTVAMLHGVALEDAVAGFDTNTAKVVTTALAPISQTLAKKTKEEGIVKL